MARVEVRDSLPEVRLLDMQGRRVSLRSLKGLRQAAIFLFHAGGCDACRQRLREFAGAADRYAAVPAAVIAVPFHHRGDQADEAGRAGRDDLAALARELQLNFILARDPDGGLLDRFAPPDPGTGERIPCCLIADAFGEIYAVLRGEDAVEQGAILDWMDFIDIQCPE